MIAAIYSRKSVFSSKGESVENQIQICKDYGQRNGFTDFAIYEDEGYSGKNTARPGFQKMMEDAKKKKFKAIICYKLDRISRNVADFSSLIDTLQKHDMDFISVTDQFDTSTVMGRAMMYISSVFAQMERETIAERVRDNMLMLAKTGRWLGGQAPLGFESEVVEYLDESMKRRQMNFLKAVPEELKIVKLIYELYLKEKSITKVVKYLYSNEYKTKLGADWSSSKVQLILRSPLYVKSSPEVLDYLRKQGINVAGDANGNGILTYNKTKQATIARDVSEWVAAVAKHKGVIEASEWIKAQQLLDANKDKAPRLGTGSASLLSGLLHCKCGSKMYVRHGHYSAKTGQRIQYYVCEQKDKSSGVRCNRKNVRVDETDKQVKERLKELSLNYEPVIDRLREKIGKESMLDINNEISNLEKSISQKEMQINNLVTQLSLDPSVTKYIVPQIQKLSAEVDDLKRSLAECNSKKDDKKITEENIEILIENIRSLRIIDILPFEKQRSLIHIIVDDLTYDSDTGEVHGSILGFKKKE